MNTKEEQYRRLRKRLLNWHYSKSRRISIVDLLDSSYQTFRNRVCNRLEKDLDFREAIKQANLEELQYLDNLILEIRLGI